MPKSPAGRFAVHVRNIIKVERYRYATEADANLHKSKLDLYAIKSEVLLNHF
jgi:hypothetical protein